MNTATPSLDYLAAAEAARTSELAYRSKCEEYTTNCCDEVSYYAAKNLYELAAGAYEVARAADPASDAAFRAGGGK